MFIGILIAIEQLCLRAEVLIAIIVLVGVAVIIALKDILSNIASKYFFGYICSLQDSL